MTAAIKAAKLALVLVALAVGSTAAPAASSDAHRPDIYGNYGGLKSGRPLPGRPVPGGPVSSRERGGIKQPYPYRYYEDTSRGNTGCYRFARRAIDTNNSNWWLRYRACTEVR